MGLWNADPPQGFTSEQELLIIGRSPIPRFEPPQGLGKEVLPPPPSLLSALVQTGTLSALVDAGTLSALVKETD